MTVWKLRLLATVPVLAVMGIGALVGKERTTSLVGLLALIWICVQGFLDLFVRGWRKLHPFEHGIAEAKTVPRWLVVTILMVSGLAGLVGWALSYLIKMS